MNPDGHWLTFATGCSDPCKKDGMNQKIELSVVPFSPEIYNLQVIRERFHITSMAVTRGASLQSAIVFFPAHCCLNGGVVKETHFVIKGHRCLSISSWETVMQCQIKKNTYSNSTSNRQNECCWRTYSACYPFFTRCKCIITPCWECCD